MALGGTYATGTVSLANGGTTITGVGSAWDLAQILEGDTFYANGDIGYIGADATSDTALTLMDPWEGAALVGGDYRILKTSWKRYDPAITQAKTRDMLAFLMDTGVFYYVDGDVPDDGIGEDGQYAIKVNAGPWKVWYKVDGDWVYQGGANDWSSIVNITNTTDSTAPNNGSLVTAGGIGLTKGLTAGGRIKTTDTTASTSTTTGSGIFGGGVGITGALYVGGITDLGAATIVRGQFTVATGALGTMILTAPAPSIKFDEDTGNYFRLVQDGNQIGFRYNDAFPGVVQIASTTVAITPTTAATSTSTGALTIGGGLGLGGNAYIGGSLRVGADPYGGAYGWFNAGAATNGVAFGFSKTRDATNARRWNFADAGGLSGDANGGAFWRGFTLTGPTITDPSGGANVYPTASLFYEFNSLTAPSTRNFVLHMGNASGTAYASFKIRTEGSDVLTANHLGLTVHATTASTSATTGSAIIVGGIGVGGAGYFGSHVVTSGSLYARPGTGQANIYIDAATAGNQSILNWADAGVVKWQIWRNSDNSFRFYDNAAGGDVVLFAGSATMATGQFKIAYTTPSTSTTTGAGVINGGLGVVGNAYIGGTLNVAGPHVNYLGDIDTAKWATSLGAYALSFLSDHTDTYVAPSGSGSKTINGRTYRPKIVMSNQGFIYSARSHVTDTQAGGMVEMRAENAGTTNGSLARSVLSLNAITNAYMITQVYTNGAGTQNAQIVAGGGVSALTYSSPIHNFTGADGISVYGNLNSSRLSIPLTTASTSTTTGAVQIGGGLGVVGKGYFGGDIVAQASIYSYNDLNMTRSGGGGAAAYIVVDNSTTTSINIAKAGGGRISGFYVNADVTTITTAANSSIQLAHWIDDGNYNVIALNGNRTGTGMIGILGGATSNPSLYYFAKSGGTHEFRVNNGTIATISASQFNMGGSTAIATSSSTGAVVTAGGLSAQKDIFAGKALHFGTGSDAYGPGSIYADANYGVLIRGLTASPTNYEFAFYNQANARRIWVATDGNFFVDNTIVSGLVGGVSGALQLRGATSGSATIKVAAIAGTTNFQLPVGNGSSGQVLSTDGSGNTSWANAGGSSAIDWQSFSLSLAYQAKQYGTIRRMPRFFADGFADSAGVNAGASSKYSVDVGGKRLVNTGLATASYTSASGSGNRTGMITVTTTLVVASGSVANLINGSTAGSTAGSFSTTIQAVAGLYIRFDFGAGKVINEAKWYQSDTSGSSTWKWQGSNDASSWTDIGGSFTLGGATTVTITTLAGNSTSYRYYQLVGVSGSMSNTPWLQEIEFQADDIDQTATHTGATASGNTVSASSAYPGFDAWKAFDKVAGQTAGTGTWTTNSTTTGWLQYQFGAAKTISFYTIRSGNGYADRAPKTWTLLGSNTGAFAGEEVTLDTRTNVAAWAASGEVRFYSIASPASYSYYRLNVTANQGGGFVMIDELALGLSVGAADINMTMITAAQTSASVNKAKAVLEIDNAATPTLNTDLTIELTCDNGTNWTSATLSSSGNGQGGRLALETNEVTCTTGTQFAARVKTFNNKLIPIHGLAIAVS